MTSFLMTCEGLICIQRLLSSKNSTKYLISVNAVDCVRQGFPLPMPTGSLVGPIHTAEKRIQHVTT